MTTPSLQITVDVPDEVAGGATPDALADEARRLVILDRFRRGELSSAQAARLLELTRIGFLELCGSQGLAVIQYDAPDFERELAEIRTQGR